MIQYSLDDVTENMVLGQSIYGQNGKLILAAGFRMDRKVIDLLKRKDYRSVYIEEPGTETIIPEDIINAQVRREAETDLIKLQDMSETILNVKEESTDKIKKIVEDKSGQFKAVMMAPNIRQRVGSIIESLLSSPRSIMSLSSLKTVSGYRYQHSLNATVIALHLGLKFNYNPKELEELGMGVLLMDIGMIALPKRVLEKEGPLTPDEQKIVREHPNYGYIILQKSQNQMTVSNAIALQHHERQDGTGYPRGIKGTHEKPIKRLISEMSGLIHRYSEIAAVADSYDAMTSTRPYASAKTPAEAIGELLKVSGTQLNKTVVQTLVDTIPIYPVGSRILIENSMNSQLIGYQGVVAEVREDTVSKPVILLLKSKLGDTVSPPIKVDLAQTTGITIRMMI